MHVVAGRQMLAGRLPLRDMVEIGVPLQSAVSALAEHLFGYRLLSEALVGGTGVGAAAVFTLFVARRASGSLIVGVVAALLQIATAPRTYSYPKVLVYAAGIAFLWHYIDRPHARRAAALAGLIVVAFLLRHDHGIYLALTAAAVFVVRHHRDWRDGLRPVGVFVAVCGGAAIPFLLYVSLTGGIGPYVEDLVIFATREAQKNNLEEWPRWPLRSPSDIARWEPRDTITVPIAVRWSEGASDETRREAARRHGIAVPETGAVESGRYMLTNIETANVRALIRDPAIEDTAGLDRETGIVTVRGLRIGALHLLPALDTSPGAEEFIAYVIVLSTLTAVVVLVGRRITGSTLGEWETLKIGMVAFLAVLTSSGFIREPLEARVADAIVAPLVLMAWLAGWALGLQRTNRWRWHRPIGSAVAFLLLISVVKALSVIGAVPEFRPAALTSIPQSVASTWKQLSVTPPRDRGSFHSTAHRRLFSYVDSCTSDDAPLLVLWFAPEIYYYADRPFAGRLPFYSAGYWSTARHERANIARLEHDRPVIAISEKSRETNELQTFPALRAYLVSSYGEIGQIEAGEGQEYRVWARKDVAPVSTDQASGWPCYR